MAPPWDFTIKVPDAVRARKYAITAVGALPAGQPITPGSPIHSNSIGLIVEGPETPATLRVQPSILNLYVGGTAHLLVFGEFEGGQKLELSRSTRIMYKMDNPGIIRIGDQGLVTALAAGSTKLTITYGEAKAVIPVTVSAASRSGGKA